MNYISRIEAHALEAKVNDGPKSSLADMPVRNALLLKLTDNYGCYGWGEAWCNFPPRGNLSKLMLLEDALSDAVFATPLMAPHVFVQALSAKLTRMIIHTGEDGPFRHLFAAIDSALHDMNARRADQSLAHWLNDQHQKHVEVYASSPPTGDGGAAIERLVERGHNRVKIKIGFDPHSDEKILKIAQQTCDGWARICIDANQSWSLEGAIKAINHAAQYDPEFIEEPLLATDSRKAWAQLAKSVSVPLAAGENICSEDAFSAYVSDQSLKVVQPDIAKWGGVSGAIAVDKIAHNSGVKLGLHYMGSAVGLAASLHMKAASRADGFVELDANSNPLRTSLGAIDLNVENGKLRCPVGVGIGFDPDESALKEFSAARLDIAGKHRAKT